MPEFETGTRLDAPLRLNAPPPNIPDVLNAGLPLPTVRLLPLPLLSWPRLAELLKA